MNRLAVFVAMALLGATAVFAETRPNTYGTSAETVAVFGAADFDPITSSVTYGYNLAGRFATTSPNTGFQTTLKLPAGSSLIRFELDACDNSSIGEVQASVLKCVSPFNSCSILGDVFTGVAFSDGGACGTYEKILTTPETINNESNVYYVQAQNVGNFTSNTRFNNVRVYYKLQVSPAPGSATFVDVPVNHIFFQYIEALAASGITTGCGGSSYCPDAFVTRGQMAVFLSRGLGLHWTP